MNSNTVNARQGNTARKGKSWTNRIAVGAGLALAAGAASAQVDVSGATGAFEQVKTAVESVGPLMVGAVAAGIVFKWVVAFLI